MATAPRITAAAAIIGIDAARTDPSQPHPVQVDIVEPGSGDRPPPSSGEAVVTQLIDRYGWAVTAVLPTEDDPGTPFAYTVGLTAHGHLAT